MRRCMTAIGDSRKSKKLLLCLLIFSTISILYITIEIRSNQTKNTPAALLRLFHKASAKKENLPGKYFSFDDLLLQYKLNESKVVLFWYIPFNDYSVAPEFLHENPTLLSSTGFFVDSSLCGKCQFTYDRRYLTVSDAVVFHALEVDVTDMPPSQLRRDNQSYVWWLAESSSTSRRSLLKQKVVPLFDYFNLTMTVRRSSGVYNSYGTLSWVIKLLWYKERGQDLMKKLALFKGVKLSTAIEIRKAISSLPALSLTTKYIPQPGMAKEIKKLLVKKDRMAAWIVSNCGLTDGGRMRSRYVDYMRYGGLRVDQFGGCNDQPFPIKSRWDPGFFEVLSRYKFYLSMENSYHCKDYMTEKLWFNALYSGAVPVIFGPHLDDVAAVLPPKSYIHADNFDNHLALVGYLFYLDRNVTAYAEYLEWRTWVRYLDEEGNLPTSLSDRNMTQTLKGFNKSQRNSFKKFAHPRPSGFCDLCRKLHEHEVSEHRAVHDMLKWLKNDRDECFNNDLAWDMSRLPRYDV